jgi:hypothetical protein
MRPAVKYQAGEGNVFTKEPALLIDFQPKQVTFVATFGIYAVTISEHFEMKKKCHT